MFQIITRSLCLLKNNQKHVCACTPLCNHTHKRGFEHAGRQALGSPCTKAKNNIKRTFFDSVLKGRDYIVKARHVQFKTINDSYSGGIDFTLPAHKRGEEAKKLALFNSSGYLELAIYKSNPKVYGGASTLYGLEPMDTVTVEFL